jgi:hypothetical protein
MLKAPPGSLSYSSAAVDFRIDVINGHATYYINDVFLDGE